MIVIIAQYYIILLLKVIRAICEWDSFAKKNNLCTHHTQTDPDLGQI